MVFLLVSAICIGTGGSVGREGPIVQIGSAIGSTIGQIAKISADRMRTLVGCGAAAGIAATFNAPIAKSKYNSFPVVNIDKRLVGIISFADYRDAVFNEDLKDLVIAKDLATTQVQTIALDTNLLEALEAISYKDFAVLPVVSQQDDRELLGVVSRRDILGAYDKAVLKKTLFHGS